MLSGIKEVINKLNSLSKNKPLKVISHNDTDGITSAAIFSKALQRWNKKFSLEIVKNLEKEFIEALPENQVLIFLDLGSGMLPQLEKKNTEVIILDHHEIPGEKNNIPKNVTLVNPTLLNEENIAGSAICYLFAKELSEQNKDLATLAVIGMIGDMLEKHIGKIYSEIIKDAEVIMKKGLLLYPATRPLDRVLENSYGFYIPGVSGSFKGTLDLLREAGIQKTSHGYKSLAELTEEEMTSLGTSIMLRKTSDENSENQYSEVPHSEIIGNIFLTKFFNTLEDAREISARINACSRMGFSDIALGLCIGNKELKKESERIYIRYKKTISHALNQIQELEKISSDTYLIVNAKDKIKDTIVGTIASIMSFSPVYPEGTVIVVMAYSTDSEKIKVSARLAGRKGRNVREIMNKAASLFSEEVGGHPNAAGCLIPKEKEKEFLKSLQQALEIELVRV